MKSEKPVRVTLETIRKRPALYWGNNDCPFSSLVAFWAGLRLGGGENMIPDDFHRFVAERIRDSSHPGGRGWMTYIQEQTETEQEAFELFFSLCAEYDRCHTNKEPNKLEVGNGGNVSGEERSS